jgi:hypothetical protein
VLSLKYLMDACKYDRDPKIAFMFKKQKNIIREILDRLDKGLEKHLRRDVSNPQGPIV